MDLAEYTQSAGFPISTYSLISNRWSNRFINRFSNFQLFRLLKLYFVILRKKPKLIHAFDLEAGFYVALVKRFVPFKFKTISGYGASVINSSLILFFLKRKFFHPNLFICNSLCGLDALKKHVGHRCEIKFIRNGINISRLELHNNEIREIEPRLLNKTVIGYIGKMDEAKHGERILELAHMMISENDALVFIIIGNGPFKEEMLERWKGLNEEVKSNIIITGEIDNAAFLARHFKIGLLCSDTEGFPNVLLEYMYFGVPWVSTNVGDVSFLNSLGRSGSLVEKWDIMAFKNEIGELLNNTELYHLLGENGKRIFNSHFTIETMGKEYLKEYILL